MLVPDVNRVLVGAVQGDELAQVAAFCTRQNSREDTGRFGTYWLACLCLHMLDAVAVGNIHLLLSRRGLLHALLY